MSLLERSYTLWGSAEILESDPAIEVMRGGFYLPYTSTKPWGIFDASGQIVKGATDFREDNSLSHNQIIETDITVRNLEKSAPAGTYIYGGYINPHYGHYIINSLPRLWAVARLKTPNTKILCHGAGHPAGWFQHPFIASMMAALGLKLTDFVAFPEPTRLDCIVIPHTSFREQHTAYRAFAHLCQAIGSRLLYGRTIHRNSKFAYYSKSQLTSAVGAIDNEIEIDNVMRSAGVDVIFPEKLSFVEQLENMSHYACIMGTLGSFLHTSVFGGGNNIVCLNVSQQINSNFTLIDRLVGNTASYYYPPAIHVADSRPGFLTTRHLPDAPHVAQELLQLANAG